MAERWPVSVSVVVILENGTNRPYWRRDLVLVRKRQSGLWTTISGSIEDKDFSPVDTGRRELYEEAGITEDKLEGLRVALIDPVVYVVTGNKTSVGVRCESVLLKDIPPEGYGFESDEIDYVKPWSRSNLYDMANFGAEKMYKPEFNVPLIRHFLEQNVNPWVSQ